MKRLQERRIKKFESVLDRVRSRAWSQVEAAERLGMSERTFRHWRDRFEADGAEGLDDRRLGKVPARRVPVDTVIGKTRFDLRAPAGPTQGAPAPVDRRILYVEDNSANRQPMERVVARVPHMDLITADTAERGLAMIESERPDTLLTSKTPRP